MDITENNTVRASRRPTALLVIAGVLAMALAGSASAAKVRFEVGTFGSAAQPTFSNPGGIAIDRSTGDLLVIDISPDGAGTIRRFNPDGTPDNFSALGTNVIDAGEGGGGKACGEEPASCDKTPQNGFSFHTYAGTDQIAIDNSGTATDGNIYVTQGSTNGGGVITRAVDIFASTGKYLGQLTGAGDDSFGSFEGRNQFSPCGVAVGGNGDVFVGGGGDERIFKFKPTANPPINDDFTESFETGRTTCGLTVSGSSIFAVSYYAGEGQERLFKLSANDGTLEAVIPIQDGGTGPLATDPSNGHVFLMGVEYDASGDVVSSARGVGPVRDANGVAVQSSSSIYISGRTSVRVFGPTVSIPDVTTRPATITGDTSVRLEGTVNADGVPVEECFFEYGKGNAVASHLNKRCLARRRRRKSAPAKKTSISI